MSALTIDQKRFLLPWSRIVASIFHTPIESPTVRRVRAPGLQPPSRHCRPGALTRRSGSAICGLPAIGSNFRFLATALILLALGTMRASALDLTNALVVFPPRLSGPERKAVTMLVEEVEKRTGVRWPAVTIWPSSNAPVIFVGTRSELADFT